MKAREKGLSKLGFIPKAEVIRMQNMAVETAIRLDPSLYEIKLDEEFFDTHLTALEAGIFLIKNTWFAVGILGAVKAGDLVISVFPVGDKFSFQIILQMPEVQNSPGRLSNYTRKYMLFENTEARE
jgi:hypothetical protein